MYQSILTGFLKIFLKQPRNLVPSVLGALNDEVPHRSDAQRTAKFADS